MFRVDGQWLKKACLGDCRRPAFVALPVSFLFLLAMLVSSVDSHGRMIDPPARNTMWRYGFPLNPINYNDDECFCGGITTQWQINKGRCGVCGDDFQDKQPRKHEMGGYFGNGIITRFYQPGEVINVTVILATNHQGWMEWRLCPYLEEKHKKEVDETCLENNVLPMYPSYKTRYIIPQWAPHSNFTVSVQLKLPERMVCKNCVLQWHYFTGNFWNVCKNGTGALGCGDQETYRNCADIAIGYRRDVSPWYKYASFNPIMNYVGYPATPVNFVKK